MRYIALMVTGMVLLTAAPSGGSAAQMEAAGGPEVSAAETGSAQRVVEAGPAPVMQAAYPQDPANELYLEARQALNRGEYRRAVESFSRVRSRYPDSRYAGDAMYWEAFALQRLGGTDELRRAVELLETQGERYPDAATRSDAATLATRIRGELARHGDAEAAESVTREARGQEACPRDEDDMRVAALNALLNMDAERAIPILERVLERRDDCSIDLRKKAVFLLAQKERPATEAALLEVIRSDPALEVKEQAVFWLSNVSTDRAVEALQEVLRSSDEPALQEKALFALSNHGSARAHEILRDYALREDVPENLREKAIFWIGQDESAENAQFLRDLYGRSTSQRIKERVIFALAQMDGQGSRSWLLELSLDPEESMELRKKALFWAGQSGIPIGELSGLYDRMQETEMKQQLIFTLAQRDERGAVDKLMEIARSDADPDLRKKALFWLGQSDDPRVTEFLMELIDQ